MDTFPLLVPPDWGLEDDVEADVDTQTLGDGYTTRRPKGINYLKASWTPTWSFLGTDEADTISAWLQARLSVTPFLWNHPVSGVVYQVVCTKLARAHSDVGINVVSATFEQDFSPA